MTIKSEPETYTLTFDDTVISEAQVRALLPISPHPLSYNIEVPILERCIEGDPRYFPCGRLDPKTGLRDIDDPNFLKNAQVNLEIGEQQMAQLQSLEYPEELAPVWKYAEGYLSLTLWLAQTQYDFYGSWDTELLKSKHEDFDPSRACSSEIAKIDAAESEGEKYELTHYDWTRCVLDAFVQEHLDKYPIEAWKRFLKAYGIKEKYEVDVD